MPRPTKWRKVGFVPESNYFKPAGIPVRILQEVALSLEEMEAIRLKDQEGLQQEECAHQMGISRPTFHRVLGSARSKISDALTNGKAIRIEGGNFEMDRRRFRCGWDKHEWRDLSDEIQNGDVRTCFMCDSPNVEPTDLPLPDTGGKRRRRGQNWRGNKPGFEQKGR